MSHIETAAEFDHTLSKLTLRERVSFISQRFSKVVFGSSFGLNDQVLIWAIATQDANIELFEAEPANGTADAVSIRDVTRDRYALEISSSIGFENARNSANAIISSSSASDDQPRFAVWDSQLKAYKFNPLADYSDEMILDSIFTHEIPINFTATRLTSHTQEEITGFVPVALGVQHGIWD